MTQIRETPARYSTETFDAIVRLAQTLRPQWETPGLRQAIRDSLARDEQPTLAEIAYAVCRVAENFSIQSPAVIAMDGPHWRKAQPEQIPPSALRCPRCGVAYMPTEQHDCRRKAKGERVVEMLEPLRGELHDLNSRRCIHDAPVALCVECSRKPESRSTEETADA